MFFNKILLAVSLLTTVGSTFAADGALNFSGSFTSTPCQVNINGSDIGDAGSVGVPLGTWSKAGFTSLGIPTDLKPIKISLSACPDLSFAIVRFMGNADEQYDGFFSINPGENSASNVLIGLYHDTDGGIIVPNFTPLMISLNAQDRELTVYASYMSKGVVGSALANADVTLDINYE